MDLESNDWIYEHPSLIFYSTFLFVGSVVSIIVLLRRETIASRLGKSRLSPWRISPLDFCLFLVALILWGVISGSLFVKAYELIYGVQDEIGTVPIIFAGVILQLGMLYIFFRFRFHFRSIEERSLNENAQPVTTSLLSGLIYFLASFPIIILVGIIWNGILEGLRQFGFEIELPLQETITLFQNTDSFFEYAGLFFLAVIVAPIVEEFVFRAGVYRFFRGRFGIVLSMLLSGFLFAIVHGNLQSLPGLVAVGACLAFAYENSKDLKVAIVFHALFNLNSIIWISLLPSELT